jgi:hypothetical protein
VVATALVLLCTGTAGAQLIYGMEGGTVTNPDGFGPNGGGITIAQDVVGVTEGLHSMNVAILPGATFVGALTTNLPANLTPPLGNQSILFDYTIVTPFTGAFSVVGVTMFGSNASIGQFGLQAQFADIEHLDGKAPGTYTGQIDLTNATNPLTFATNQSYNDIFQASPDANHIAPSGFELFFNKSNDAAQQVYIDNVRFAPEPASLSVLALGGLALIRRRRRA